MDPWLRIATGIVQAISLVLIIDWCVGRYAMTRRFGTGHAVALTVALWLGVAMLYLVGLRGAPVLTLPIGAVVGVVIAMRKVHRRSHGTSGI